MAYMFQCQVTPHPLTDHLFLSSVTAEEAKTYINYVFFPPLVLRQKLLSFFLLCCEQ